MVGMEFIMVVTETSIRLAALHDVPSSSEALNFVLTVFLLRTAIVLTL
jgi:hypothetical protein